jgi:uncharacterized protein (DUF1697 family)
MTVMVALLRGINVGGHSKLLMADLRAMVAGCGLHDVETYIQSGNVVCTADDLPETVGDRIASAIHSSVGLSVPVTVRTRDELAALADGNEFLAGDDDPAHHHLLFRLDATPVGGTVLDELAAFAPERVTTAGRDVYLHLPDGMAASKVSTVVARRPELEGTVRNWRTVGKLLDIASAR